ncbi:GAF domain-containing protein [Streptomyces sp. NPDC007863]|uniref:sensor histidine kinase n=1 Tax=Streptomyces sp. NPDC007863 TaxID=3154894 RepID=UPI0033FFED9B
MDEDVTGEVSGETAGEAAGGTEPEQARLPLLLEAVLGVGTDLELRATLQHIVDSATELVGARHGALRVVDPERPRLTGLFTTGMTEQERARVGPLPDGAAEGLGVPIRVHTQVFGNLHLTGKEGGFTEEDLALLRVLAAQAGIAIGNARLYETARQRERWIEGAAAVTTALLTGESAEDALMTVAEQARILAGAAAGVILQPTPEGGMEIVTASTAGDPGELVGTTIRPGSAVLVQLLGGEPVFVEDSATDPRMTTPVRSRFGPSMMLPLRSGGRLIGTLALPRHRDAEPYSAVDRLLASQFASQAALALVLADARHDRERLAVFEDRDRIARDLHDLVVQRLFATEMMLESTRRRAGGSSAEDELLGRAVDELDSTIQEVRTTIFALQQPPAEAPTTFRGRVLRETGGAGVLLGFQPSVRFTGAVDTLVAEPEARRLLAALRGALAAAHRRPGIGRITVDVGVGERDGGTGGGAWLRVEDDGTPPTTVTWP